MSKRTCRNCRNNTVDNIFPVWLGDDYKKMWTCPYSWKTFYDRVELNTTTCGMWEPKHPKPDRQTK